MSQSAQSEPGERLNELVDRAEASLERLDDGEGTFDVSDASQELRDLYEIAVEAIDLLDDIDLSELPEAIDASDLIAAIDAGELAEAIFDEDEKFSDAISLRALLRAINLRELVDSVDLRAALQDKQELEDEIDDVTGTEGNEDDGGLIETDDDGEWLDTDMDVDDVGMPDVGGEGGLGDIPGEAYQTMIQEQAMDAVDEFREGVLEAHDKLKKLHEENRERMRRTHEQKGTGSRNPTAHSTVPTDRMDVGGSATQHSTVSKRSPYSTAPTRRRIYGNRFDNREDDSE